MILPPNSIVAERYMIKELLGHGAISEVYLAYDLGKNDFKALKLLISHLLPGNHSLPLLMNQIEASIKLRHPNIVSVNEIGTTSEGVFITMPFIKGKNLKKWMDTEKLLPLQALNAILSLISDIGSALDYAHRKGIIHRDIKPSNIMIDREGKYHLLDFGAALRSGDSPSEERPFSGTPPYHPPRQFIIGTYASTWIDVYSFAYIIKELFDLHFSSPGSLPGEMGDRIRESRKVLEEALDPGSENKYQEIRTFCDTLSSILSKGS